ncbi:MAG: hypothetical protein DDT33_01764 [Firmicutes bacterium]|nr:hypothetical protein [Bacillota bacterium]
MERTAVIANLAENIAYYIEAAQKERGLDEEDINLAIRWAKKELGGKMLKYNAINRREEMENKKEYRLKQLESQVSYLMDKVKNLQRAIDRLGESNDEESHNREEGDYFNILLHEVYR